MAVEKFYLLFKDHAVIRMLERGITKKEITETINDGELIEEYADDNPYPSALMFKIINAKPIHVIVAHNKNEHQKIIVTVYIPDSENFEADFKTRKK